MSLENFIPTVWSARLLQNLNKAHVYASLANRDYEGEIAGLGDTVKINSIGAITVGDYTKNADIPAPQELQDGQTSLLIDKAKYFNFQVDDVDKAQQKPKVMDATMEQASWGIRDTVDVDMAGIHTSVPAANKIGADGGSAKLGLVLTAGSAFYDYLVDLFTILSTNNALTTGRWVVVPPWATGALSKDPRWVNATDKGNGILTEGFKGRAAGFDVYESNNVTTDGQTVPTYRIVAGHSMAVSYAEQIVSVEAYRMEKRFADAVKGLLVYGKKVVRPSILACLYAKNAAA